MKFLVDIRDTSYATIEVIASTREEAEEKAQVLYNAGRVEWQDCDLEIEAHRSERNG